MFTDHRALGRCQSAIFTGPQSAFAISATNNPGKTIVIRVLTDAVFAALAIQNPITGVTSDAAPSFTAGSEILGIKSFTLTSGQIQFFLV